MKKILENKNIILTGSRGGIGSEMLELFASHGANVWAHARVETEELKARCQALSDQYQVQIWPLCFDLSDPEAMKEAVKAIQRSKIPVDGLVNNAGITYNALFQMSKIEKVREQMEINFFAPYQFTQYIVKLMVRNKRGSVVNIASRAAVDSTPGKSAYGASKAALIAMTRSMAKELGAAGIRANCIAPGVVNTDMLLTMPEYIVEEEKEHCDQKRIGTPRDIAGTAAFLLSDLSSYITGQVINVDGGAN